MALLKERIQRELEQQCQYKELEAAYKLLAQQQVELEMQHEALLEAYNERDILRAQLIESQQTELIWKTSKRERQVLRLVNEKKTSKQISEALFISVRTVEGHRSKLIKKLGTDLMKWGEAISILKEPF